MTMNYACLGVDSTMQDRRYEVLKLFLKGHTPRAIADETGLTIKKVYNDLMFLRTNPLHDLPLDMVRDFGKSFYELKIGELEEKLKTTSENTTMWLGIQKLIKEYKIESLKIQGASIERIEHSGQVDSEVVHVYIPQNDRDNAPHVTQDDTD